MTGSGDNGETTPVREGFRFDEAPLSAWLNEHVEGFRGPLQVTQFKGGQSNPTFQLATPSRSYVLRRQPTGQLLRGAHAVDREARVISALASVDFPVPRVFALCEDPSVIGSLFYVMDKVPGRIFWDSGFATVPRTERAAYLDAMNETLARLHTADIARVGLSDFGRAENYMARQVNRWSKQYLDDPETGRNAHMDAVIEWLQARVPAHHDASIIHGDFRVDNMIFHPQLPRVVAVLDWELSTLGDPIADFTYHLMMYRLPSTISGGLSGTNLAEHGLIDESEYIRRYCARTQRERIDNVPFYLVFNLFRFAAILHGIKGRMRRGTAASANPAEIASNFDFLAEQAARLAHAAS
ncbi:MAG: phosphotransferase family protein [Steroidobacteraceae bacterium]